MSLLPLDSLPDVVLLKVFSFLPQKDLRSVSGVNKRWNRLAYDQSLWKSVDLNIGDLSRRKFAVRSLLDKVASGVRKLRLKVASNLHPAIYSALPVLPNLVELDICYDQQLEGSVAFLVGRCPSVKIANFGLCNRLIDNDVIAMASGWPNLRQIDISSAMSLSGQSLKHLFSTANNLELVRFERPQRGEDANESLKVLIERHGASLKSLYVGGYDIKGPLLTSLVTKAPQLEELSIMKCESISITERSVAQLKRLTNLQHLCLNNTIEDSSATALVRLLAHPQFASNLQCLTLGSYFGNDDVFITSFSGSALKSLSIGGRIGYSGLKSVVENCKQLEILEMNLMLQTEDWQLLTTVPHLNLPKLTFLQVNVTYKAEKRIVDDLLKRCVGLFVWSCNMTSSMNVAFEGRQNVDGKIVKKTEGEKDDYTKAIGLSCCRFMNN